MNKKSFVLIFSAIIFGIILFAGFTSAMDNCPPVGPPKVFSGGVYYSGSLISGTYTLSAVIDGQVMDQVTVSNGKYSDLQVSPCSGVTGEITFVVNGVQANETSTWNNDRDNDWGQEVTLDLHLSEKPTATSLCGNDVVNLGEECDGTNLAGRTSCGDGWEGTISCTNTCVVDYSNCTRIQEEKTTTPSTSSGGGGGSSSSSGGGGASTTSNEKEVSSSDSGDKTGTSATSTNSSGFENIETKGNFFRLTGAAISNFSKSKAGKGVGIILLIVIILGGVYYSAKKASDERSARKTSKKKTKKKSVKKKSAKNNSRKIKIVKLSDLRKAKK